MCAVDDEGRTLASAALVGLDGSVWAHSPAFPSLTTDQAAVIAKIFNGENPGSFMMGDVKYMVLGSEDPSTKLRGKCKGGGCSISKTTQAMVVGIWAEPVQPATCNKLVEALAEYLISVNY